MSDGYLCDGCNELKKGSPDGTVDSTLVRGDVELCLTCVREFKAKYGGSE